MKHAAVVLVVVAGCGRLGFGTSAGTGDGGAGDGNGDSGDGAAPIGAVSHVGVFAQRGVSGSSLTDTFTAQAVHAGDAIALHVFCNNAVQPTAISVTASGWSFAPLGTMFGSTSDGFWAASFGAIAPDTNPVTVSAVWSALQSCVYLAELGDEFTGNAPGGGAATFDDHVERNGNGDCVTTIVANHANDTIWAGCSDTMLDGPGTGFTASGVDPPGGDRSEYRATTDPAGTIEAVGFHTSTGTDDFVVTAVAIAPP